MLNPDDILESVTDDLAEARAMIEATRAALLTLRAIIPRSARPSHVSTGSPRSWRRSRALWRRRFRPGVNRRQTLQTAVSSSD
jgi:hypothetical protein